jgi:hypothetical protein
MRIPTFLGAVNVHNGAPPDTPEFGRPYAELSYYRQCGMRIVMQTPGKPAEEQPDIHIERRPCGWAIFLHPQGETDASGYVYFLDDGRSFIVPSGPDAIATRSTIEGVPEVDGLA